MKIRLNKYIAEAGICSRRQADRKIEQGKVRVNGRAATLGDLVDSSDRILVDGNPLEHRMQRVYLAYNKPVGVTSTTERSDPDNIIKAVGYHGGRIFPVGRLDKDSHGLILLTNDGDIVNNILRVSNAHDKEYLVHVDRPVTDDFVKKMSEGVSILGTRTRPCRVIQTDSHTFRIILQQGLNRQIRRMCKVLGYTVKDLQRTRIMHIHLENLAMGTWRFLTDKEEEVLMSEVGETKAEPAPKKVHSYGRKVAQNKPVRSPKKNRKPGSGTAASKTRRTRK